MNTILTDTENLLLTQKIEHIREEEHNSIRGFVVTQALEDINVSDPAKFFSGLLTHGCVSGWVNALVWHNQTHAFYDKYYDEIEKLREEYEKSLGQSIKIRGDLKNFFAWFAFEETAYRIANEIGLDI